VPDIGGLLETLVSSLLNALAGIVSGAMALASVTVAERIYQHSKQEST